MTGKRFSIVLPVRDGGAHVRECVASILAQTLADDFELLVLDNASTDGTTDWLATLRDPRVRLHPAGRPLSIEENWARVREVPRGEYMTIIGHDDLLDPDFLETMDALVRAHPDAGLYFAHFRLIDGAGRLLRSCRPMPARETAAGFLAARLMDRRDTFGTGYVMRSADYDRVGGIPPYEKLLHADDALWMQLMEGTWKATSPRELFSYRLHGQSASGASDPQPYLAALERYHDALEAMAARDPAVREVLGRHGPAAGFRQDEYLHKRFLVAALTAGEKYPADVPARLHRVRTRFTGADGEAGFRRKRRLRGLEILHRLPGGRWVFRRIRFLARLLGQEHRLTG